MDVTEDFARELPMPDDRPEHDRGYDAPDEEERWPVEPWRPDVAEPHGA